jgi:hypothetical protein
MMRAYGHFKKGLVSIYFDIIRIFSALVSFEMGYFSGEENPELGFLNFYYSKWCKTLTFEVLKIHKFSIMFHFKFTKEEF